MSVSTVRLEGSLTISESQRVMKDGTDAVAAAGDGEIEIDLSGVSPVDSIAIAALLHWERNARMNRVRITLLNPSTHMRHLVDLYGVGELLNFREETKETG